MSEQCAITSCKRTSRALCYCCQQSLCVQHMKEHNDLLVSQLNPLVDQINGLGDRLKAMHIENKDHGWRKQLEKWRMDSHKEIDDFFQKKCIEIDAQFRNKLDKQRNILIELQSKLSGFIQDEEVSRQDINLLTSHIENLNQEIENIERSEINIKTRPIPIDDNLIQMKESGIIRFDLLRLSPVRQTINYTSDSSCMLANSEQLLLMHRVTDLCLIDRNLKIVRQIPWNNGLIQGMCWSSSLNQFIFVSKKVVFSLNENPMTLNKLSQIEERNWHGCTCSNTSLYLSTYEHKSSVMEYSLSPTMKFIKEWKSPVTCGVNEWINNMKYKNESIALLINNTSSNKLSIELKHFKTFHPLWSFQMNNECIQKKSFHFCSLDDNEWLLMDHDTNRLLHITKDENLKSTHQYHEEPLCATMFGPNLIVISTDKGINFHTLKS